MHKPAEQMAEVRAAVGAREPCTAEELLPLVYGELRRLAAAKLAREPAGHTLQPTALVHEAWLRLVGPNETQWNSRGHFFGAAAEAMRRILVENARRKQRLKHGGGQVRIDLSQVDVAAASDDATVLAVSEALDKLTSRDPLGAELVRLRFFAGLTNAEAAKLLSLPERTAKRTWAYARAWLYEELRKSP
jgi:RNA polymerase sigma factor (TIGR02999 family)